MAEEFTDHVKSRTAGKSKRCSRVTKVVQADIVEPCKAANAQPEFGHSLNIRLSPAACEYISG
jgi:hypothetical protein